MSSFSYHSPERVDDAVQQLGASSVAYAGGTDLLTRMKLGLEQPARLVDLKRTGLGDGITELGDEITFGPLTTIATVARSAVVIDRLTALAQAAAEVATPQIRNRATLGGTLLQRPRCWYYRDPNVDCWLKGGEECPARDGRNEHHAIFDESPCVAVHPSDLAACLLAFDATVQLTSPVETKWLPIAELFVAPTDARRQENVLDPDQLITNVRVSSPADRVSAYRKAMGRGAWAFALAGVAVTATIEDGVIRQPRVVLAGVANVPRRARATEEVLADARLGSDTIEQAAGAALHGSRPLSENRYKQQLIVALVRDALSSLRST